MFDKKKIIVSGGPTREWIDPVRFISNESSGKMGIALAMASFSRLKNTVFIHGPVESALLSGLPFRTRGVETTADMLKAVLEELEPDSILIMAAAPADYRPAERSVQKIKKRGDSLTLEMVKNPDILKTVAEKKIGGAYTGLYTAGFAAETIDTENYALGKLKEKNLDIICLNDVSRSDAGFRTDTNVITVFMKNGERHDLPMMSKIKAADEILKIIENDLQP
jgi:phosphopantothenoylcysteine decarboxylase/phosphopantothenate--cysteine ligase